MISPVILAGGKGTRLWPFSRENYPKQYLAVHSEISLLQQSIVRLTDIEHHPCMFICNEQHRFIAAEQLRQLAVKHNGILLEPDGRNTAPAIALAAIEAINSAAENQQPYDPTLLVLAADHVIEDERAFKQAVQCAHKLALAGKMVTFGIVVDKPETGYGYIKCSVDDEKSIAGFKVSEFVEKPNLETAQQYLAENSIKSEEQGTHTRWYWNSGMFMFKASRYLQVLEEMRPDIYKACQKSMQSKQVDNDFIRVDEAAFKDCPSESIDYAVMEPLCESSEDVVVVPLDAGWSDIGEFTALWQVFEKDKFGNAIQGDVTSLDTKNSLILAQDRLVATIGVEDLVIVDTKDALLVAHKDSTQQVKEIVNQLQASGRKEACSHTTVYRPWGKYELIAKGDRYQVKRITVNPGAKLSVQMHHHRAEHWIVVSGEAKITNGDKHILLTENQSTYIPLGTIHALENPIDEPLELIEIQSGSYLGEDDIVRFEDRYGRQERDN